MIGLSLTINLISLLSQASKMDNNGYVLMYSIIYTIQFAMCRLLTGRQLNTFIGVQLNRKFPTKLKAFM